MSRQRRHEGCPHPLGSGEQDDEFAEADRLGAALEAVIYHGLQFYKDKGYDRGREFGELSAKALGLACESTSPAKIEKLRELVEELAAVVALDALSEDGK